MKEVRASQDALEVLRLYLLLYAANQHGLSTSKIDAYFGFLAETENAVVPRSRLFSRVQALGIPIHRKCYSQDSSETRYSIYEGTTTKDSLLRFFLHSTEPIAAKPGSPPSTATEMRGSSATTKANSMERKVATDSSELVVLDEETFRLFACALDLLQAFLPETAPDLSDDYRPEITLNKLRAILSEPLAVNWGGMRFGTTDPQVPILRQAIADGQGVSFAYQTRSQAAPEIRRVVPWQVIFAENVAYLWGYDLERGEPRTFRLSRFRSTPEQLAQLPAEIEVPPKLPFDADKLQLVPLLWIRQGQGSALRMMCRLLEPTEYPPGIAPQTGWDLCEGELAYSRAWERRVLRYAEHVVVAAPSQLRDYVWGQLNVAAKWGEEQ